jgi:hypothetical protein
VLLSFRGIYVFFSDYNKISLGANSCLTYKIWTRKLKLVGGQLNQDVSASAVSTPVGSRREGLRARGELKCKANDSGIFLYAPKSNVNEEDNKCDTLEMVICLPFMVHWVLLVLSGVFFLHIQVLTRLIASSSPAFYWFIASLLRGNSTSCSSVPRNLESAGAPQNLYGNRRCNNFDFLRLVVVYFLSYFVIGTVFFASFFPWT